MVGTLALTGAIAKLSLLLLGVAVGFILVAVALQGRGHRLEPISPEPFSGPINFVSRLFFRAVGHLSAVCPVGGWLAALRKTPKSWKSDEHWST